LKRSVGRYEFANVSAVLTASIIRVTSKLRQPTNQPEKVTNGRVKRRHRTSPLASLGHSFVRNALLEFPNGALNYNVGRAYANGVFVAAGSPVFSNQGLSLLMGDYPVRQIVLYVKDFG
jgi:hypothetical protein